MEAGVDGFRSSSGANIVEALECDGRAVSMDVVGKLEIVVIWAFGYFVSNQIYCDNYTSRTYLFGYKVQTTQGIKFVTNVIPQILNLLMILLELGITGVNTFTTRLGRLIFLFVDLCEGF